MMLICIALFVVQVAWNGSVSHNWVNRITTYRDTIIEDSPALINGALNMFITATGMVNTQILCNILFCLYFGGEYLLANITQ